MHKLVVVGNLGSDPEMKKLESGLVTTFQLASTNKYQSKEITEWFSVSVFGKQAEAASQWLKKGSQVYVEGSFKTRVYVTREGERRVGIDLVAHSVEFCGGLRSKEDVENVSKSEPAAADGSGVPAAASA